MENENLRLAASGGRVKRAVLAALLAASVPAGARTFDVTQFGAKGDGRADDGAAVAKAIAAAGEGGTVYLPAGRYKANVVLPSGVTLAGDGPGATFIVAPESKGMENSYAIFANGASFAQIRDLAVVADARKTAWAAGIRIAASSGVRITNVAVSGCDHGQGIVFDEAPGWGTDNLVTGSAVRGCSQGIVIDNESTRVIGNYVEGCKYGLSLEYATPHAAVVSGNVVDGKGRAGSVGIIASGADHAVISGNNVRNVDKGVYIKENSNHILLSGNMIYDVAGTGIMIDSATYVTVKDNVLDNVKRRALHIENAADCDVSGNVVSGGARAKEGK